MGKIFTFWSPYHCAGATTNAILMANQLSKKYSVCLIDLDLDNSDVGFLLNVSDTEHNIDNLTPYIIGNSLTDEIFKSNLVKVKKFFVLQGTKNIEKGAFFKQNEIEPIIDKAKELFDVVVLNTAPGFDNIATFLSLKKSDMTLIVMEQRLSHFNKLTKKMQSILKLCTRTLIILNGNSKNLNISAENIYNTANITVLPMEVLTRVKIINELNLEKNLIDTFYDLRNRKFIQNIEAVSLKMEEIINFNKD